MTTETILTDLQLIEICQKYGPLENMDLSRAIEQAVLQSPEIQALRKDAEIFQFILEEAWFQRAFDRFDPDDNGDQSKFESECRRILIAAMGQQP